MKKLIKLYFLLSVILTYAQEIQFVNASSGLIIRDKPSKKSKRIGKLENGVKVRVIRKTEIKLNIVDDGETIKG